MIGRIVEIQTDGRHLSLFNFISLGNELKPERGDNIPVGARYFGNELKTEPPHLRRFFPLNFILLVNNPEHFLNKNATLVCFMLL